MMHMEKEYYPGLGRSLKCFFEEPCRNENPKFLKKVRVMSSGDRRERKCSIVQHKDERVSL